MIQPEHLRPCVQTDAPRLSPWLESLIIVLHVACGQLKRFGFLRLVIAADIGPSQPCGLRLPIIILLSCNCGLCESWIRYLTYLHAWSLNSGASCQAGDCSLHSQFTIAHHAWFSKRLIKQILKTNHRLVALELEEEPGCQILHALPAELLAASR